MQTDDKAHVMIIALDTQLGQMVYTGQGTIGGHINRWNQLMSLLSEQSPDYHNDWAKQNIFKSSLQSRDLLHMHGLQVCHDYDLVTLQTTYVRLRWSISRILAQLT